MGEPISLETSLGGIHLSNHLQSAFRCCKEASVISSLNQRIKCDLLVDTDAERPGPLLSTAGAAQTSLSVKYALILGKDQSLSHT